MISVFCDDFVAGPKRKRKIRINQEISFAQFQEKITNLVNIEYEQRTAQKLRELHKTHDPSDTVSLEDKELAIKTRYAKLCNLFTIITVKTLNEFYLNSEDDWNFYINQEDFSDIYINPDSGFLSPKKVINNQAKVSARIHIPRKLSFLEIPFAVTEDLLKNQKNAAPNLQRVDRNARVGIHQNMIKIKFEERREFNAAQSLQKVDRKARVDIPQNEENTKEENRLNIHQNARAQDNKHKNQVEQDIVIVSKEAALRTARNIASYEDVEHYKDTDIVSISEKVDQNLTNMNLGFYCIQFEEEKCLYFNAAPSLQSVYRNVCLDIHQNARAQDNNHKNQVEPDIVIVSKEAALRTARNVAPPTDIVSYEDVEHYKDIDTVSISEKVDQNLTNMNLGFDCIQFEEEKCLYLNTAPSLQNQNESNEYESNELNKDQASARINLPNDQKKWNSYFLNESNESIKDQASARIYLPNDQKKRNSYFLNNQERTVSDPCAHARVDIPQNEEQTARNVVSYEDVEHYKDIDTICISEKVDQNLTNMNLGFDCNQKSNNINMNNKNKIVSEEAVLKTAYNAVTPIDIVRKIAHYMGEIVSKKAVLETEQSHHNNSIFNNIHLKARVYIILCIVDTCGMAKNECETSHFVYLGEAKVHGYRIFVYDPGIYILIMRIYGQLNDLDFSAEIHKQLIDENVSLENEVKTEYDVSVYKSKYLQQRINDIKEAKEQVKIKNEDAIKRLIQELKDINAKYDETQNRGELEEQHTANTDNLKHQYKAYINKQKKETSVMNENLNENTQNLESLQDIERKRTQLKQKHDELNKEYENKAIMANEYETETNTKYERLKQKFDTAQIGRNSIQKRYQILLQRQSVYGAYPFGDPCAIAVEMKHSYIGNIVTKCTAVEQLYTIAYGDVTIDGLYVAIKQSDEVGYIYKKSRGNDQFECYIFDEGFIILYQDIATGIDEEQSAQSRWIETKAEPVAISYMFYDFGVEYLNATRDNDVSTSDDYTPLTVFTFSDVYNAEDDITNRCIQWQLLQSLMSATKTFRKTSLRKDEDTMDVIFAALTVSHHLSLFDYSQNLDSTNCNDVSKLIYVVPYEPITAFAWDQTYRRLICVSSNNINNNNIYTLSVHVYKSKHGWYDVYKTPISLNAHRIIFMIISPYNLSSPHHHKKRSPQRQHNRTSNMIIINQETSWCGYKIDLHKSSRPYEAIKREKEEKKDDPNTNKPKILIHRRPYSELKAHRDRIRRRPPYKAEMLAAVIEEPYGGNKCLISCSGFACNDRVILICILDENESASCCYTVYDNGKHDVSEIVINDKMRDCNVCVLHCECISASRIMLIHETEGIMLYERESSIDNEWIFEVWIPHSENNIELLSMMMTAVGSCIATSKHNLGSIQLLFPVLCESCDLSTTWDHDAYYRKFTLHDLVMTQLETKEVNKVQEAWPEDAVISAFVFLSPTILLLYRTDIHQWIIAGISTAVTGWSGRTLYHPLALYQDVKCIESATTSHLHFDASADYYLKAEEVNELPMSHIPGAQFMYALNLFKLQQIPSVLLGCTAWATHSDSQDALGDLCILSTNNLSYDTYKHLGIANWIRNNNKLQQFIDKLAMTIFKRTKNPTEINIALQNLDNPHLALLMVRILSQNKGDEDAYYNILQNKILPAVQTKYHNNIWEQHMILWLLKKPQQSVNVLLIHASADMSDAPELYAFLSYLKENEIIKSVREKQSQTQSALEAIETVNLELNDSSKKHVFILSQLESNLLCRFLCVRSSVMESSHHINTFGGLGALPDCTDLRTYYNNYRCIFLETEINLSEIINEELYIECCGIFVIFVMSMILWFELRIMYCAESDKYESNIGTKYVILNNIYLESSVLPFVLKNKGYCEENTDIGRNIKDAFERCGYAPEPYISCNDKEYDGIKVIHLAEFMIELLSNTFTSLHNVIREITYKIASDGSVFASDIGETHPVTFNTIILLLDSIDILRKDYSIFVAHNNTTEINAIGSSITLDSTRMNVEYETIVEHLNETETTEFDALMLYILSTVIIVFIVCCMDRYKLYPRRFAIYVFAL